MSFIGATIREKRKLSGLTQEELAERSGVNLRTIQRIENDESEPRGKTLVLICDVLQMDVEELLTGKKNSEATATSDLVFGYILATKGIRFLANLVETVIYTIVIYLPYLMITTSSFKNLNSINFGFAAIVGLIIGAIWYPLFSGNLGHKIFNLKVISSVTGDDYEKAPDGAIREMLKGIFSFFIIPIIWILWDDKNQNLYDKLTKTYVVQK